MSVGEAVRERRSRLVRSAAVLTAAGAITTLVAGVQLFAEFGVGALLAALGGLAVLAGGVGWRGRLVRAVRYRIDRPYSAVWLTAKLVALVGVLAGAVAIASALDAPPVSRTVIVVVVVGALSAVAGAHAARWTLFQVDATGVRLGGETLPWPSVGRLDLAIVAPGTAEIGVRRADGTPASVAVPSAAVSVDDVRRAVHEFGNPAIQVVAAPVPGELTAPIPVVPGGHRPAGPRRGGAVLIGALSLVVVAAVVAVAVLQPWRSDAPAPSPQAAGPNGKDGFHWALSREEAGFHVGLWATQGGVVFGNWKGFTAYDVETGEELWSWRVPEGNQLCAMTQNTANRRGAFTYGSRGPDGEQRCHHLQAISVKTGEPVWAEPVSLVDDGYTGWLGKLGSTALSISDNLVTAAHAGRNSQDENSTDLIWVDARHGERAGVTDVGAQPVYNGCRLSGYAQAQSYGVLAVANCADGPKVINWDVDGRHWGPGGELTGCDEISHAMGSGFVRFGGEDWLVGCGSSAVDHLHRVDATGSSIPVDLDGVAVEDIESGALPENVLLADDDVYLPRGAGRTSDGVSMISDGQPWGYTVRGASKVRLMAVAERAVTVLVVDPGPATLYTVAGPNEVAEGPELPPEVARELPGAEQAVRVGDYLVCGFSGREENDPVIGVVRLRG